ncbi:MAG: response regulator [Verrucomicrobia bacterium]|nr:response regulator [Verrucomicrobiota bacterium]
MLSLPTAQDPAASATKPLAIIVADDVEGILHLVQQYLEGAGHTVACATTGHEVIRLLAKQHFDLVITDVLMPDGDGLDVIVAAKRNFSSTRILAISGGGKYMVAGDCLRIAKGVGAHGLLLKPFSREQLLAAIEQVIRA